MEDQSVRRAVLVGAGALAGAVFTYFALGKMDNASKQPLSIHTGIGSPSPSPRSAEVSSPIPHSQHSLGHPGPIIIGVAGASGSGKTSMGGLVAAELRKLHVEAGVMDLSCDSYYKTLPADADSAKYNFDHPQALDWDLLVAHLEALRAGGSVQIPHYSFVHHKREGIAATVDGSSTDVIILDGIFVLVDPRVRALLDISVFTSEDPDVCLVRRLKRDLVERGRSVDSVLKQYIKFVRPGFQSFVAPTMQYADLIIPRAKENTTAIGVLARECARKVVHRLRTQLSTQAERVGEGEDSTATTPLHASATGTQSRGEPDVVEEAVRAATPGSAYLIDSRQEAL